MHHHTAALIVAAGRGNRAGGDLPKQWQSWGAARGGAKPCGLCRFPTGSGDPPDDRPLAEGITGDALLVEGGATRDASVLAGLRALQGQGITHVLIHDGARPLVSQAVIGRVLAALDHHRAAAPPLPSAMRSGPARTGLSPAPATAAASTAHKRRKGFTSMQFSPPTLPMAGGPPMMSRWRAPQALTSPSSRATKTI